MQKQCWLFVKSCTYYTIDQRRKSFVCNKIYRIKYDLRCCFLETNSVDHIQKQVLIFFIFNITNLKATVLFWAIVHDLWHIKMLNTIKINGNLLLYFCRINVVNIKYFISMLSQNVRSLKIKDCGRTVCNEGLTQEPFGVKVDEG